MPISATQLAYAIEALLAIAGAMLLWRFGLSPAGRATAPALPKWEIAPLDLIIFGWCVFFGGVSGLFVMNSLPFVQGLSAEQRTLVVSGGAFHLGVITGVSLYALWMRGRFSPNGPQPDNILVSGFVTFLIAMPAVYLTGFIFQGLMTLVGLPLEKQLAVNMFRTTDSVLWRLVLGGLAVVVAPVSEELIFRAGFFRFLRARVPRWAALLLPACIFAWLHGNLASAAQLTVLAVILSLAYERTGKIGTPMIAHALFNFHTVLLLVSGVEL